MSEPTKRCPFCGEEVLAIATKCKHCGSAIENASATPVAVAHKADYGIALLAIPVVATILVFVLPNSGLNLLQVETLMLLVLLATVGGTALIAAIEASKSGVKSDGKAGSYSPTSWFFIVALLWIVGYPAYLYKRKRYGLSNQLVPGLLVALIFLGCFYVQDAEVARWRNDYESFGAVRQDKTQPPAEPRRDGAVATSTLGPSSQHESLDAREREYLNENLKRYGGLYSRDCAASDAYPTIRIDPQGIALGLRNDSISLSDVRPIASAYGNREPPPGFEMSFSGVLDPEMGVSLEIWKVGDNVYATLGGHPKFEEALGAAKEAKYRLCRTYANK